MIVLLPVSSNSGIVVSESSSSSSSMRGSVSGFAGGASVISVSSGIMFIFGFCKEKYSHFVKMHEWSFSFNIKALQIK